MYGFKIKTDLTCERYELSKEKENYIALQKAIDCDMIDIIHAVNLPEPYCLVVDDEGLLKDTPTTNLIASWLYGFLTHGQTIVGDVIIMKDKVTPDGIETIGLEQADFDKIESLFFSPETSKEILKTHNKIIELCSSLEEE